MQERVDRRGAGDGGNRRTHRGLEAPVLTVGRALGDPAAEDIDLRGRDLLVRIRRWHHFLGVFREEALDQFAAIGVARLDRLDAILEGRGAFGGVEAELALALLGVEAVAGEAVIGKDRADVPVEIQFRVGGHEAGGDEQEAEGSGAHGLLGKGEGGFGGEEGFGVASADLEGADGGEVSV